MIREVICVYNVLNLIFCFDHVYFQEIFCLALLFELILYYFLETKNEIKFIMFCKSPLFEGNIANKIKKYNRWFSVSNKMDQIIFFLFFSTLFRLKFSLAWSEKVSLQSIEISIEWSGDIFCQAWSGNSL